MCCIFVCHASTSQAHQKLLDNRQLLFLNRRGIHRENGLHLKSSINSLIVLLLIPGFWRIPNYCVPYQTTAFPQQISAPGQERRRQEPEQGSAGQPQQHGPALSRDAPHHLFGQTLPWRLGSDFLVALPREQPPSAEAGQEVPRLLQLAGVAGAERHCRGLGSPWALAALAAAQQPRGVSWVVNAARPPSRTITHSGRMRMYNPCLITFF